MKEKNAESEDKINYKIDYLIININELLISGNILIVC